VTTNECDRVAERARDLMVDVAPRVAATVEAKAREAGLTTINERDHLRPWSIPVISQVGSLLAPPVQVGGEGPHGLEAVWPRLGKVDVTLTDTEGTAFVELKCGGGSNALGPCAWDALKLATALRHGTTCAGFLMAAAPEESWRTALGSELFTNGARTAVEIRERYRSWWTHWEKDRKPNRPQGFFPPTNVPGAFSTTRTGPEAMFMVGTTRWALRISEVRLGDAPDFRWERFLP